MSRRPRGSGPESDDGAFRTGTDGPGSNWEDPGSDGEDPGSDGEDPGSDGEDPGPGEEPRDRRRRTVGGRTRRDVLAGVAALGVAGSLSGCAGRGTARGAAGTDPAGPSVALEPFAEGLTAPLGFESPPGTDRHYVVDQTGTVEVLAPDGGVVGRFLDVRDRMVEVGGYDERGLLGMAFHPEFPDDDRVFVRYSAPKREGTPDDYDHTFVLAEFRATPDAADPASERTLLEIPEPQMNHNAGAVVFGPDGLLYVGVGDGGAGADQGRGHVGDWYDAVGGGNGQDVTENLLGSVLRIDVDDRTDGKPYGIPEDNPLVGREGLDEQFAWGFRNPWRMSFGPEGRLIVGDVGQSQYEEVSVVERGGNYGWNVREGRHCFGAEDCPDEAPSGAPLRGPVVEYDHGGDPPNGVAVVAGYVYRGSVEPLRGRYVFGDWRAGEGGGLFAATPGGARWPVEVLSVANRPGGRMEDLLLAFGTDADGELYVTTSDRATVGGSGAVYRVAAPGSVTDSTPTATPTSTPDPTATASDPTGSTAGRTADGSATPTAEETPATGGTGTDPGRDATGGEGTATGDGGATPGFGALGALAGVGGLAAARALRRVRDGGSAEGPEGDGGS